MSSGFLMSDGAEICIVLLMDLKLLFIIVISEFLFQSALPVLDNPLSKKVRSLIDSLRAQRMRYMKVIQILCVWWSCWILNPRPSVCKHSH